MWVDGVVRVVSGLSQNTSCQDVVIALAQAIGQTGRYVLILRLRGSDDRQLVADDRPLHRLAQLGQLATEVQFILRWIGPSLSDGPDPPARERRLPLPRPSEPEPLKRRGPQKALTFSLGPSTVPRRTKPDRAWSPSPRASPEPRASPVSLIDTFHPVSSSKEEVFRHILQQQRRLQDLEIQLQALERETELWEWEISSAAAAGLTVVPAGELDKLEEQLRQNEAELMHGEHLEEQLQLEMDIEQDMHKRLHQINALMDDCSHQIEELQTRSAHLEQDIKLRALRQRSRPGTPQPDEVLSPLKHELHHRLQQGEELSTTLSETQRELQASEEKLQDRWEAIEELNKELRQCKLQQFIQGRQPGSPNTEQTNEPVTDVYLSNAGIKEWDQSV